MYCMRCGKEVRGTEKFCTRCGAPLQEAQVQEDVVSPLPASKSEHPISQDGSARRLRAPVVAAVIMAVFALASLAAVVVVFNLGDQSFAGNSVSDTPPASPSSVQEDGQPDTQLIEETVETSGDEKTEETSTSGDASDEPPSLESVDESPEVLLSQGAELLKQCEESGDQSLGAEAVELFSRASDAGSTEAGYYLAYCSYYGYGVVRDYEQAYNQALLAAQEGNASAQALVARCLYDGTGVSANRDQCYEWASKSAEQGNPAGQNLLGNCYKHGYGVEKNLDKMIYWYELAAEAGDDNGQVNLGACYYEGRGVKKDVSKAVELYLKSAEQGNALAQLYLAECYFDGDGVKKDVSKARDLAEEAANNTRDPRAIDDARALLDEHGL